MPNTFQGNLYANAGDKFCIIVARFNEFIGSKLLSGAIDSFVRLGVDEKNIDVMWVPGAFEIPLIAKKAAQTKNTPQLLPWVLLLRVQPLIMTMFAPNFQKA